MPDTERIDIARCLLGDAGNSSLDMARVVDALILTGWIDEDQHGGLAIHDWATWQEDFYRAKERRRRDTERKRENGKKSTRPADGCVDSADEAEACTAPTANQQEQQKKSPPKGKGKSYALAFEAFWAAYPRKDDKANAYKKYMARLNDGWSENDLLRAAKNYAYVCGRKGTEKEYIKQGKTFLSEATPFTDYIPKEKPPVSKTPDAANPFAEFKDD